jgi:[acyl-carrier-protein] S-malonyltransferase
MMMLAFVFPGQGAQSVGMGVDLSHENRAAALVFEEASEICGFDLLALDEKALAQTRFTQLAIVTHSLAAYAALITEMPAILTGEPTVCAGFSVGEYSALCASGRLSLADTIRLVSKRAQLMQEATAKQPGAMAAVLGLDDAAVSTVLSLPEFSGRVFAVNYNAPGQLVIAGEKNAVAACNESLKAAGARRVVPLAVDCAFHTRLMSSAAAPLAEFARSLEFRCGNQIMYTNRTGLPFTIDTDIPAYLGDHLQNPVYWTTEITNMVQDGCNRFVECGPGLVLSGLIRKINPAVEIWSVENNKSLQNTLSGLKVRLN